jgi:hypothetical protein
MLGKEYIEGWDLADFIYLFYFVWGKIMGLKD